ncbi:hypothetical protein QQS21_011327 [Conoideocrella luteorostrata]|uniref:Uncharacterized protein n=1 Tax=Conoideocrella luteorostrata TaxID=1105319 RepID=A0AAJ0CHV8_9HYPO|nr:hypothetical protein QQS21_011327 [Conoideocrella luteorostrata]
MEPGGAGCQKMKTLLPKEIILMIVESLRPSRRNVILYPSDPITKTLLSARLVCKAINSAAVGLFHQHCMCINSDIKAMELAEYIKRDKQQTKTTVGLESLFSNLSSVSNLYLNLFHYRDPGRACKDEHDQNILFRDLREPDSDDGTRSDGYVSDNDANGSSRVTTIISCDIVRIEPNELPTACAIKDKLLTVAPSLRYLVYELPFQATLPLEDAEEAFRAVWTGFKALPNLEEVCIIQDGFQHDHLGRAWHACWPRLRRISIWAYNCQQHPGDYIWGMMARLPFLEMASFTNMGVDWSYFDIKRRWFDAVASVKSRRERLSKPFVRPQKFTLVLADDLEFQPQFEKFRESWSTLDPDEDMQLLLAETKISERLRGLENPTAKDCLTDWALNGLLWDPEARGMRPAPFEKPTTTQEV